MIKRLIEISASSLTISICLIFSLLRPINCDVAWGLTMSEKLLDGQRLYIDILETNPPMTVWLHMPAVGLSRVTGLSADSLQILLTFLALATCLAISWRILAQARMGRLACAFTLSGAVALTLPWLATVSEREHWALAGLTPIMAVQIVQCARRDTTGRLRVIAGALAGLALAIKPVFVLCVLAPAVYAAWRTRSIQSLFRKEYWIAAGVSIGYLAAIYWGYPAYRTNMLPGLLDTYFQVRVPLISLASPDLILSLLAVGAFFVARGRRLLGSPAEMIPLLTGFGFLFAYVWQGKGFLNHAAPICSLILMTILLSGLLKPSRVLTIRSLSSQHAATLATIIMIAGFALLDLRVATDPNLYPSMAFVEPIRHLSPTPRILAVSGDLKAGHPLARAVNGQWVSATSSQWLAASAALLRQRPNASAATRMRMQQWIHSDLDRLTSDVIRNRPDVIIFDDALFSEGALSRLAPKLARALSAYERAGQSGSLRLLILRREPSGA